MKVVMLRKAPKGSAGQYQGATHFTKPAPAARLRPVRREKGANAPILDEARAERHIALRSLYCQSAAPAWHVYAFVVTGAARRKRPPTSLSQSVQRARM